MKNFKLAGTVIDREAAERLQPQWESFLEDELSQKGFVRCYDIDPTLKLTKSEAGFEWELFIRGVYVGKQAPQLSGVANGVRIPRPKSKQQ